MSALTALGPPTSGHAARLLDDPCASLGASRYLAGVALCACRLAEPSACTIWEV
jgi:hypothetical protein